MKIAITGHRPNKLGNDYDLTSLLIKKIKEKIVGIVYENDGTTLISGMALGIDMLFALIAIELKLPLIAAIPFKGQEIAWPIISQVRYHNILKYVNCSPVIVSEGGFSLKKMQLRNEWMVDNSDLLIAVWDGTSGDTANCVQYANTKRKHIVQINPKNIN